MSRLRTTASIIITSSLLPLVLSYNACTKSKFLPLSSKVNEGSGTVVGNPKVTTGERILSSVCEVVHRCHPEVTFEQCNAGFSTTVGVQVPLGLASTFATLSSISQAEEAGILTGQTTLAEQCSASIAQLECANPLVQKSYLTSLQNPFSGAVNLISGQVCGSAVAPVARYACSEKVFLRGVSNTAVGPLAPSAGVTYSIAPALPQGLSLDSATGEISGSPAVVLPSSLYTITATSAGGVSTSTLNIRTADGYLVNDLSDAHNVGAGCVTSNGSCTLRAAIEANNSSSSSNVILLPKGQIKLSLGELLLNSAAEIYGDCEGGTIIDGQNSTRVFHLASGPTKLQNLTLQNGTTSQSGAGLWIDGSASEFKADLLDVTIQNNTSSLGGGAGIEIDDGGNGHAVTVSMNRCKIQNNTSTQDLGGGMDVGGNAVVTMKDCVVQNNVALIGGGMLVNGTVNVDQSLFQNNTASTGPGGAIYCASSAAGSRQVHLTNVTITDNTADRGGGIVFANNGIVTVLNSTIVNNHSVSATYGGGITSNGGGGSLSLQNSIVAKNQSAGLALNCGTNVLIQSNGFNLSDQNDCGLTSTGDQMNVDPLLGPLQNNGGFSNTFAILPGSPAIRTISPATNCPTVDQRGANRGVDGRCDIGAFEVQ